MLDSTPGLTPSYFLFLQHFESIEQNTEIHLLNSYASLKKLFQKF